jgi:hypothetical protein
MSSASIVTSSQNRRQDALWVKWADARSFPARAAGGEPCAESYPMVTPADFLGNRPCISGAKIRSILGALVVGAQGLKPTTRCSSITAMVPADKNCSLASSPLSHGYHRQALAGP